METPRSARLVNIRCSEHVNQRPEYFCCDKLICAMCYIHHKGHESFMTIEDKSTQIKEVLPNFSQQLVSRQAEIERKLHHIEYLVRQNKENIHKRIKQVIDHLRTLENDMKKDCLKNHEQVGETLNKIIEEQRVSLEELQELQISTEKISSYKSATEVIRSGIKLTRRLKGINTALPYTLPQIPEFVCPTEIADKSTLQKLIGTMNMGLDMDSDLATSQTAKFDVDKYFKWHKKNIRIAPISSYIAWIYTPGESICLVSKNGDKIKEITKYKSRKIEKVFVTRLKNAWVTDLEKCSVKILRENGDLDHMFSVGPLHPFGICPTNSGDSVWICLVEKSTFIPSLDGRALVTKRNNFGDKICDIEFHNGKKLFKFPFRCAENVNGDLCVIDKIKESQGQVIIFDNKCQPKTGYIATSVNQDFDPCDICCNSMGEIIVSDLTNNAIHILHTDGNLKRLIQTDSKGFVKPISIGVDDDDRIWTSFYDGNIAIFKNY